MKVASGFVSPPEVRMLRRTATRIGIQAALLVAVTVALLIGAAVMVVLRSQHASDDTLLATSISRADDVTDPPAGVWLIVQGPKGTAASPGLPSGLPDLDALRRTAATGLPVDADLHTAGREYRIKTARSHAGTIEAALDLRYEHAERDRLIAALVFCGGMGLLLAAGVGAWLGNRAAAPMADALALQRRFVADAGHELRTPLTLLSTRAQLLRRRLQRGPDPQVLAEVDDLVSDSAHLAAILDDLLLAADPRVGPQEASAVDLAAVAREVVAATTPSASAHSIELHGPPQLQRVPVRGAPVALRRAVTALTDNAVQHARHTVSVTVGVRGNTAVLEVADDGPGIAPDVAARLFERFTSTGHTRPDGTRSYGLGLALVSEIAARHSGQVTADNRPGSGATLRLILPSTSQAG